MRTVLHIEDVPKIQITSVFKGEYTKIKFKSREIFIPTAQVEKFIGDLTDYLQKLSRSVPIDS